MIKVEFDDFTEKEYASTDMIKYDILEAHAEGVDDVSITDTEDEDVCYSLIWDVELQKEG